MSLVKQRKITQNMKFVRQNLENRSDIHKLQNQWEEIRQRHQRYCEKATRLNCNSSSSLLITLQKLHLTSISSLILCHYNLCIDCNLTRVLTDFFFQDLIDSLVLYVYCIDTSDLSKNKMRWCSSDSHNVLHLIFQCVNNLEFNQCVCCKHAFLLSLISLINLT